MGGEGVEGGGARAGFDLMYTSNPSFDSKRFVHLCQLHSAYSKSFVDLWSLKCLINKGRVKKNQLCKIPYRVLTPPWLWKISFYFFLKLDHFWRTFCKKCIFTIENPKKNFEIFSKNDHATFKQANFCLLRCNNSHYTQN